MKKARVKKTAAIVLILAVTAVILFGIAPFTLALLLDSESAENTFTPGNVTLQINETFDHNVKSDVTFTNTGNVPAYIRVALVPIWRHGEYNSGLTADGTYDLNLNMTGWTLSGGYYYYNDAVPAGGTTSALIASCTPKADLDPVYTGMAFEMQIIASALQADGWNAATDTAIEAFAAVKDTGNKEY